MKILNCCRVFLQVYYLSDIVSANGKRILEEYKEGQRITDRYSRLSWPSRPRLPPSAWLLWKTALLHLESSGILKQPLGRWMAVPHQCWTYWVDTQTNTISRQPSQMTRSSIKPYFDLALEGTLTLQLHGALP